MRDDMVPGEELRRYIQKCSDLERQVSNMERLLKNYVGMECYGAVYFVDEEEQIRYAKRACITKMKSLMEERLDDDDLFYIKRTDDGRISVGLKVYVKGGDYLGLQKEG